MALASELMETGLPALGAAQLGFDPLVQVIAGSGEPVTSNFIEVVAGTGDVLLADPTRDYAIIATVGCTITFISPLAASVAFAIGKPTQTFSPTLPLDAGQAALLLCSPATSSYAAVYFPLTGSVS